MLAASARQPWVCRVLHALEAAGRLVASSSWNASHHPSPRWLASTGTVCPVRSPCYHRAMIKLVDRLSWRSYQAVSALDWAPIGDGFLPPEGTVADALTVPDFEALEKREPADARVEYPWDEGRQTDGKPLLLIDFDGVINAFPDDKLLRRGGQTGSWLEKLSVDDPRRQLYSLDNAFLLDHSERVTITQINRYDECETTTVRIRWAGELADAIRELQADCEADVAWLSTWQPWTDKLERELGFASLGDETPPLSTVRWYDPVSGENRAAGKLYSVAAVLQELQAAGQQRPIVWIDDEEADAEAERWLRSRGLGEASPLLMIQPDDRIGVSRSQWKHAVDFMRGASGETNPGIYADRSPHVHLEYHVGW